MSLYKEPLETLKPCPFCGSDKLRARYTDGYKKLWYVECDTCGAERLQDISSTDKGGVKWDFDCIAAWNKRAEAK